MSAVKHLGRALSFAVRTTSEVCCVQRQQAKHINNAVDVWNQGGPLALLLVMAFERQGCTGAALRTIRHKVGVLSPAADVLLQHHTDQESDQDEDQDITRQALPVPSCPARMLFAGQHSVA